MNKNNLDSFKEKANAILLKDAMLNVNGGYTADACHPGEGQEEKLLAGYSHAQIDRFFSNADYSAKFNSMYKPGSIELAEQRMMFFDDMVSQGGSTR